MVKDIELFAMVFALLLLDVFILLLQEGIDPVHVETYNVSTTVRVDSHATKRKCKREENRYNKDSMNGATNCLSIGRKQTCDQSPQKKFKTKRSNWFVVK